MEFFFGNVAGLGRTRTAVRVLGAVLHSCTIVSSFEQHFLKKAYGGVIFS